eukprot:m.86033 g.86033  ORF g.86033 m.86033 type:complete len:236 (-) comp13039_c0_seq1:92-799(-)
MDCYQKVSFLKCEEQQGCSWITTQLLFDGSGSLSHRPIWNVFAQRSNVICYIYDITNSQSFIDVQSIFKDAHFKANEKAVKVLIGNKLDLDTKRQVSQHEARAWAEKNDLLFGEVSATIAVNGDRFHGDSSNMQGSIETILYQAASQLFQNNAIERRGRYCNNNPCENREYPVAPLPNNVLKNRLDAGFYTEKYPKRYQPGCWQRFVSFLTQCFKEENLWWKRKKADGENTALLS